MSDPIYRPPIDREQERIDIPLDDPNALEPVAPPQEPLFNKKAMVLWALGAFIVWFMVTQSVPIAKRAAREAIIQRIQEAETNTGRHITVERKNGRIVRIITEPGPAAPAAVAPPSGTEPAASPTPPAQPEAPAKR